MIHHQRLVTQLLAAHHGHAVKLCRGVLTGKGDVGLVAGKVGPGDEAERLQLSLRAKMREGRGDVRRTARAHDQAGCGQRRFIGQHLIGDGVDNGILAGGDKALQQGQVRALAELGPHAGIDRAAKRQMHDLDRQFDSGARLDLQNHAALQQRRVEFKCRINSGNFLIGKKGLRRILHSIIEV